MGVYCRVDSFLLGWIWYIVVVIGSEQVLKMSAKSKKKLQYQKRSKRSERRLEHEQQKLAAYERKAAAHERELAELEDSFAAWGERMNSLMREAAASTHPHLRLLMGANLAETTRLVREAAAEEVIKPAWREICGPEIRRELSRTVE